MRKKSLSLTELALAIALLGTVILGATAFDVGSRHFLQSTERKAQVVNEATLILDHITKNAVLGIGDFERAAMWQGPVGGVTGLLIKQDANGNGLYDGSDDPDPPTNGDRVVAYNQEGSNIYFYPNYGAQPGSREILSRRGVAGGFQVLNATQNRIGIQTDNRVGLRIALRSNPAGGTEPFTNPQVTIQTTIEAPGWSLQ
ncbi:MAG: hypothetical protein WCI77_01615 [Candidatus Omnitrophota bacterium]